METSSRKTEVLREQGRKGGLADGQRRRLAIAEKVWGMTLVEIYRSGYEAGYRARRREVKVVEEMKTEI